jgi:hypothetical protein
MKYSIFAFLLIVVISCSNSGQNSTLKNIEDKTKKEFNDFKSLKSGVFWNELDEGKFQIVSNDYGFLDTIDKDWGLRKIKDDSYFYLQISKDEISDDFKLGKDSIYGSIKHFILLENNEKKLIKNLTSNFNDYFSSQSLIDNKLYFWGLELSDSVNSTYKIYASELNLISKANNKHLLFEDDIATDNRGYFSPPSLINNKIVFQVDTNQKWIFNKDFELEK